MSRFRHFARALASGYAAILATVVYTIFSVPLALRHLSVEEFGLWSLVLQIAGFLSLIEFGMAGSVYRFLIDHKDDKDGHLYHVVLSTGILVFAVQGGLLATIGWFSAPILSQLTGVTTDFGPTFNTLVRWQCVIAGFNVLTRGLTVPLQSHQRIDVINYVQIGSLAVSLLTLWLGFFSGWGLWSLPFSTGCGAVFQCALGVITGRKLGFIPGLRDWARPQKRIFFELLRFGGDIFLLTLGAQLLYASQIIVVSHRLGLGAAAAWAICTKAFSLAQQFVLRVSDFATPALTEMYVRKEHGQLKRRYRDMLSATVILAVFSGGVIAVVNSDFVAVWTRKSFEWSSLNNWLLAGLLVISASTRCLNMCMGFDKRVGPFRYIYFLEGLTFVATSWFVAPALGFTGILLCAIGAGLLWSGLYGLHRTSEFFEESGSGLLRWFIRPGLYGVVFGVVVALIPPLTNGWPPTARLVGNGVIGSLIGTMLLWNIALDREQRRDLAGRLAARLGFAARFIKIKN